MKTKAMIVGLILVILFSAIFVGNNYCLADLDKDKSGQANIVLCGEEYSISYLAREMGEGVVSYDFTVRNFPYKIQIIANDQNELRADQIIVEFDGPLGIQSRHIRLDFDQETITLEVKSAACSCCSYHLYYNRYIYNRFLEFPLTAGIGNLMERLGYPQKFYTACYPTSFSKYAKIDLDSDLVIQIREMGDSIVSQLNEVN